MPRTSPLTRHLSLSLLSSPCHRDAQLKAAGNKLVVIDFWASWCGPCKQIAPKFVGLSKQFGKRAVFLKVDVDANKPAAQKFAVQSMPTFVFAKKGKEIDRFSGADEGQLKAKIASLS